MTRRVLAFLALLVLPALALAQTTPPPTVFTKGGTPISTTPVITVDTNGVYVSPGGAAYTGPLAAQLPTALGAQTGAASLSVVPNSNTAFPVTDNAGSLTVDSPQLPASLGVKTSAASLSVTPASDATFTVGLPSGASTSALQSTGNTALTTINSTLGAPFQAGGSIGNTSFGALAQPSSSATYAIVPGSSSAAEGSRIVSASAANLYRLSITTAAAGGYLMVFNATSAPTDGAVTPVMCRTIGANSTLSINMADMPSRFSTGITAVFSTTGCFLKTISTTAFFEWAIQ